MRMTRRSLLGSGVAAGGIAILAACGTAVAPTGEPKADMAEAPKAEEAKVMEEKPVLVISNYHAETDPRWTSSYRDVQESVLSPSALTIQTTPDRTFDGGVFAKRNTEFAAGDYLAWTSPTTR